MVADDEPIGNQRKKRGRVENLKPWPKGVSGNPKGRPKGPNLTDALKRLIIKLDAKTGDGTTMESLARAWIAEVAKGNATFFKEMLDRLEGKVAQKTELTGTDGGPVEVRKWSTAEVWAAYEAALRDAGKRDAD